MGTRSKAWFIVMVILLAATLYMDLGSPGVAEVHAASATLYLWNWATCQNGSCQAWPSTKYEPMILYVSYANGSVYNVYNFTTSSVSIPSIGQASLITVRVGNGYTYSYSESIIPPAGATTLNMYLNPPQLIVSSVITVEDLTGKFGPGTAWYLYPGQVPAGSPGAIVVESGYTDGTDSATVSVLPGVYTFYLSAAGGTITYAATLDINSQTPNPTVQITGVQAVHNGVETAVSYGSAWSNGQLYLAYQDASGSTTQVTFQVILDNATGTYILYTVTQLAPSGCSPPSCLGSTEVALAPTGSAVNGSLYLQVKAQSLDFGSFVLGPTAIGPAQLIPSWSIDPNIMGLADVLPVQNAWLTLLSLVIVIFAAGSFGAVDGWMGAFAASGLAALLSYAGWLQPQAVTFPLSVVALVVTAIGFMGYRLIRVKF